MIKGNSKLGTQSAETKGIVLPSDHRREVINLANEAANLEISLADKLSGIVTSERTNIVNLGVLRLVMGVTTSSYRAKEVLVAEADGGSIEGAEWVTVSASTSLRRLLREYGDRLLGYDAKRDELTIQALACDVIDSSVRSVRVLVRLPPKSP